MKDGLTTIFLNSWLLKGVKSSKILDISFTRVGCVHRDGTFIQPFSLIQIMFL